MSQFYTSGGSSPPGSGIETLSAEGGAPTPPSGTNFDFSGTSSGAIVFATPANGEMTATVQVDNTSISVNGSNQLQVKDRYTGSVTTNGFQTKTVLSYTPAQNSVTTIEAIVSGYGTPISGGAGVGVGGALTAAFLTDTVSSTLIDPPDVFIQSFTSNQTTFTATNSGLDIIITVTGDGSYDINWTCKATVNGAS